MKKIRVIARLDIKDDYVVKGRQLEGVRRVGNPNEFAQRYYKDGIDEILYVDNVASLYNRNSLDEVLFETTKNIFIPVTVGGGIRTVENARYLLSKGADKIAVNTAAIKDETVIREIADEFGSQCMVLSIQAKRNGGSWEALYDNGREHSGKDAIDWAVRGEALGAGEILVTSVDKDGMMKGIDYELIERITGNVSIPVVYSGGVCDDNDLVLAAESGVSGVAVASILHYNKVTVKELKQGFCAKGGEVRMS
jgi:cyclase